MPNEIQEQDHNELENSFSKETSEKIIPTTTACSEKNEILDPFDLVNSSSKIQEESKECTIKEEL